MEERSAQDSDVDIQAAGDLGGAPGGGPATAKRVKGLKDRYVSILWSGVRCLTFTPRTESSISLRLGSGKRLSTYP